MTRTTFYWWLRMLGNFALTLTLVQRISGDWILALDAAALLGSLLTWAEVTFAKRQGQ